MLSLASVSMSVVNWGLRNRGWGTRPKITESHLTTDPNDSDKTDAKLPLGAIGECACSGMGGVDVTEKDWATRWSTELEATLEWTEGTPPGNYSFILSTETCSLCHRTFLRPHSLHQPNESP